MGLRTTVRVPTHGRWYPIGNSPSGAFFAPNAKKIAPLALNRQRTADVQECLHHGPHAPCYSLRDLMTTDCKPPVSASRLKRTGQYFICGLLIALCWFSHFSRFREMGFYEDDHWFAASTLNWSPGDMLHFITAQIRTFPHPQGRPIGFILGDLLPFISYHIGGLPGIYIASWLIFSGNTILFFNLLKRCLAPPLPLIGAIAFILFPADTTRPFICHADILQPSVMFTLIACHLQLSNRIGCRMLAYLFAMFSLLTYETALLPFAVFPLLNPHWNRRWARQFAIHLLILALLATGFFFVRKSGGESRVVDASLSAQTVAQRIWTGTGIGIDTVFKLCRTRAMQGETDFDQRRQPRSELKMVGTLIGLSVLVSSLAARRNAIDLKLVPTPTPPRGREGEKEYIKRKRKLSPAFLRVFASSRRMARSSKLTSQHRFLFRSTLRAAAFAAAGLAIAYLFCFTHYPPDYEEGRLTSTHLAATLPVAVSIAVLAAIPLLLLPRSLGALLTACLIGFYFTCLFAAARDEQRGYVQIWRARQHLWTRIVDLCPDITDGTLIAFEGPVPQPAYFMGTASWSDYLVLGEIYNFTPSHFHRDPMAAHFPPGPPFWQSDIALAPNGQFIWNHSPFGVGASQMLFDGNLILLHVDDTGAVVRERGTIQFCGKTCHLKDPSSAAVPAFPKLPLYTILTGRAVR
jgi:hypothetical protein